MKNKHLGNELRAVKDGKTYRGMCTSTRTVSGGDQVFFAGRYFFVKDLEPARVKKPVTPTLKRGSSVGRT